MCQAETQSKPRQRFRVISTNESCVQVFRSRQEYSRPSGECCRQSDQSAFQSSGPLQSGVALVRLSEEDGRRCSCVPEGTPMLPANTSRTPANELIQTHCLQCRIIWTLNKNRSSKTIPPRGLSDGDYPRKGPSGSHGYSLTPSASGKLYYGMPPVTLKLLLLLTFLQASMGAKVEPGEKHSDQSSSVIYNWDGREDILPAFHTDDSHPPTTIHSESTPFPKGRHERSISVGDPEAQDIVHGPYPVTVPYFTSQLQHINSYYDVFRIFYGDLADDVIDRVLVAPSEHSGGYYINPRSMRGRIGGMSVVDQRPTVEAEETSVRLKWRWSGNDLAVMEKSGRRKRSTDELLDLTQASQHMLEIQERWRCLSPVAHVIHMNEARQSSGESDELMYMPSCTVVYRCSSASGCCDPSSECIPSAQETIQRQFFVLRHDPQHLGYIPDAQMVRTLTFTNHTRCECRQKQGLTECLRCPHTSFAVRRVSRRCVCDCDMKKDRTCNALKRGRRQFTKDQAKCVADGQCHPPECRYGEFRDRSCPSKPRGSGRSLRRGRHTHW